MAGTQNKTVLVTGSSSGFGRATAGLFHHQGWNVVAAMRRPEQETSLGSLENLRLVRLDVTDIASVRSAVAFAEESFGAIDVLVNNAGYGVFGFLEESDPAEVQRQMDVNFFGVVNMIRAVLPGMRARRTGRIINVTSLAGSVGVPLSALYCASKFAVEGLTESLAFELSEFGIEVMSVAPGAFRTGFLNAVAFASGNRQAELDPLRERAEAWLSALYSNPPKPFGFGDLHDVARKIYDCASRSPVRRKNLVGRDAQVTAWVRPLMPERSFFKMLKSGGMPKLTDH